MLLHSQSFGCLCCLICGVSTSKEWWPNSLCKSTGAAEHEPCRRCALDCSWSSSKIGSSMTTQQTFNVVPLSSFIYSYLFVHCFFGTIKMGSNLKKLFCCFFFWNHLPISDEKKDPKQLKYRVARNAASDHYAVPTDRPKVSAPSCIEPKGPATGTLPPTKSPVAKPENSKRSCNFRRKEDFRWVIYANREFTGGANQELS